MSKKIIFIILIVPILFASPVFADNPVNIMQEGQQVAQQQNTTTTTPPTTKTTTTTPAAKAQDTNSQVCPPGSTTCSLPNPLGKGVVDPRVWVGVILRGLFGVVGSIALVLFIWGGFTIMIARGNMSEVKKGRDTMIWAAVGLGAMFGSYVVVNFIISTLLNVSTTGQ